MNSKGIFHHEELYRGELLKKLSQIHITVCGAGALGSNLVDNLTRQGFGRIRVIDFDRVELHNINNQVYNRSQLGTLKVASLRNLVFQATSTEIEAESKELNKITVKKLLRGTDLVVDCFDNSESRQIIQEHCQYINLSCLHSGLYQSYGEVVWNEKYKVPNNNLDTLNKEEAPCQVPLARNLVILTVAVLTEEIIKWIDKNTKHNYYITLKDLKIRIENSC